MTKSIADFTLRALVPDDAPRIAELVGDWEVVRWLSTLPYPYSLADAAEFIANVVAKNHAGRERDCAIVVNGRLCGLIGIRRGAVLGVEGANLGYWLGRDCWGQGIMTHAAAEFTRGFFANSQQCRLNSGYFSGNIASMSIQRRLGFTVAGERQLFSRPHGKRLPHVDMTLTRARFEALNLKT